MNVQCTMNVQWWMYNGECTNECTFTCTFTNGTSTFTNGTMYIVKM